MNLQTIPVQVDAEPLIFQFHLPPDVLGKIGCEARLLVRGAVILLENDTGNILAMVGGRMDFPDFFNRATQARRQPGSTFKPFLYMTAIDNGYPVSTQLLNQPLASTGDAVIDTSIWDPRNDDGSSSGLVTLREGLQRSLNIVSARIIQELVTPEQVAAMAKRFHISTPMRAVRAISLGTSEVLPLEITASYAALANRGGLGWSPSRSSRW
ncbi:unnamed protein product [marine sediment metagenome]|uniref:Penicillin-binding protein transpeptidase domain-containing protein n=1 Tax=marine sediment metagenome TaxID=412755 RepID=X1I6W8_9ZZZZ